MKKSMQSQGIREIFKYYVSNYTDTPTYPHIYLLFESHETNAVKLENGERAKPYTDAASLHINCQRQYLYTGMDFEIFREPDI